MKYIFETPEELHDPENIEKFGNVALYIYDAIKKYEKFYYCTISTSIMFKFDNDNENYLRLKSELISFELFDKRINNLKNNKFYLIEEDEQIIHMKIIEPLYNIIYSLDREIYYNREEEALKKVKKYLRDNNIKYHEIYETYDNKILLKSKYDESTLKTFLTSINCDIYSIQDNDYIHFLRNFSNKYMLN